ncbi:MAG: PA4642 family protein [Porticoccus sp.]|jgi:hypothetical protein|uniref:PA4642 family protein n=1 Tax=Porticoccus sp. Uisw_050_02 TaxID=3230978 RepID=UPI001DD4E13C|nr:hypothetical protein [Porticoccus sp.]|tara:strand:- start:15549 stop:15845 length:297 start_codon:yes stop_codon:yes gene_type:complete
MTFVKDKQKILGETFDDERIKTFLHFKAPQNVNPSFHLLEKSYRGMNIGNFDTFVNFFLDSGHNINAKNPEGKTLLSIIQEHGHGKVYAVVLKKYGGI